MTVVGFIGLGAMGGAMSANIVRGGYRVIVHDINPKRVEPLAELGAEPARSPAETARRADVVFSSLPGNEELEQVALGENGLIHGFSAGKLFVDMSTVEPAVAQRVGRALAERGVRMLDAPVARTTQAARDGTLAIMVGGEARDFEEVLPILRCMGTDIFHCGPLGSGQVLKLLNNLILFCNITVLAECLTVGTKAGVAPEVLVEVLEAGSADSFALRNHIRKAVLPRDFPEGKFPVTYALKDIEYALALAQSQGVPLFHGGITQQLFRTAEGLGLGDKYYPVVFEVLERFAGVWVAAKTGSAQ